MLNTSCRKTLSNFIDWLIDSCGSIYVFLLVSYLSSLPNGTAEQPTHNKASFTLSIVSSSHLSSHVNLFPTFPSPLLCCLQAVQAHGEQHHHWPNDKCKCLTSPACFAQKEERKQKVKDASTLPTLPPLWCFDSLEAVDQVTNLFKNRELLLGFWLMQRA